MPGATEGAMPLSVRRVRQNDGTRGRLQQGFFFGSQVAERARCIKIANHDGERLAVAMFALAQARDGGFVGRVHARDGIRRCP